MNDENRIGKDVFMIFDFLPVNAHSLSRHILDSSSIPLHSVSGGKHDLLLDLEPIPQVMEQALQTDQLVQVPIKRVIK